MLAKAFSMDALVLVVEPCPPSFLAVLRVDRHQRWLLRHEQDLAVPMNHCLTFIWGPPGTAMTHAVVVILSQLLKPSVDDREPTRVKGNHSAPPSPTLISRPSIAIVVLLTVRSNACDISFLAKYNVQRAQLLSFSAQSDLPRGSLLIDRGQPGRPTHRCSVNEAP